MNGDAGSDSHWVHVHGVVVGGYGVASGRSSGETAIGTIARQIAHFRASGLDLSGYYPATINVSIAPLEFTVKNATHHFPGVSWSDEHGPEDFSFSHCKLVVRSVAHHALLYYPHPETKPGHVQPPSIVEIIAYYIRGIVRGTRVGVQLDEREVQLFGVSSM